MLVSAQVNCVAAVLFVIAAVGAVMFCVMMICSVSIQPFEPVAVSVNVPGELGLKAAAFPTVPVPLLQT